MKQVEYLGKTHFEVTGEREQEAADVLAEGLTAVAKRRSAYVQGEIDDIVKDIEKDYDVKIRMVV